MFNLINILCNRNILSNSVLISFLFIVITPRISISQTSDSIRVFNWQPRYLPTLSEFDPYSLSKTPKLNLEMPRAKNNIRYYDPRNVMPDNFWELDYRHHSYYTPKDVSDHLDHIMNRPRADSFVPLPTLAFIAASLALQQLDIQKKIEIKAVDYILDEKVEFVLLSLWKKSPQTATDIFESAEINEDRTVVVLQSELQILIDKKLIKRKKMEAGPDLYFPAQTLAEAKLLIKNGIDFNQISEDELEKLCDFLSKLKNLE